MDKQIKAVKKFIEAWSGHGYEKGETQKFWLSLLNRVFNISEPDQFIQFEDSLTLNQYQVQTRKQTGFMDAYIPSTQVVIEQKNSDVDLDTPEKQSSGDFLTPFQQAKRYSDQLDYSKRPRWIVISNFREFRVYDMDKIQSGAPPETIFLKDLPKEYHRLAFLVQTENVHLKKEFELSIKAGEIVGILYDAILHHYKDPSAASTLKSLNMLCVRLVFCLYAEDAGIFAKNLFHDYLAQFDANHLRQALIDLFRVLDTKEENRAYLTDRLMEFPYVNGGLFADESIEIPLFDEEIRQILLAKASDEFNWSEISPTIFGAVFESTLNPETRRAGGMHYTSIENIHKVIDPLFLDALKEELASIKEMKQQTSKERALRAYRDKLASLVFLDPACGSGNFLTETYLSLRRLENEVLEILNKGMTELNLGDLIKVSIKQFYGIEINDFAVTVARTALWIAESQMLKATEEIVDINLDFLPLKSYPNIIEANALRIDWNTVVPKEKLSYIMGNPPFVGARLMNQGQKKDLTEIFKDAKNSGNLDYVCCWYKLASEMMKDTGIRTALVSTNSITQGEQTALLWKPLLNAGVHINFAHRTFRWDSEASIKAHVHCVIIGFSYINEVGAVWDENGQKLYVNNINPYLVDAPDIMVESRAKPLCAVPEIGIGNKPIDGGNYLFLPEEKEAFIQQEPASAKYFKPWYGADEFINRRPRYCLWLGDCPPAELMKMPECLKRVQAVRECRLASKSAGTVKLADTPTHFHVENMPKGNYIVIPETSSENRAYTPMGFLSPDVLCSNAVRLMPDATLYHFGILTSSVHMAWMRTVCGRLEMSYRYSKDIVYNNFPWPEVTDAQKEQISATAQGILDARQLYPESSLADLYGEKNYLFPELVKAHKANDRAVMKVYDFAPSMTEPEIVAELMKRYQHLTAAE